MVISGMGVASPLGAGVRIVWQKLIDGHSGIRNLPDTEEFKSIPCQVAGMVPVGTGEGEFNMENVVTPPEARTLMKESMFAIGVAKEALNDANWWPHLQTDEDCFRTGVSIGNAGMGAAEFAFSSYEKIRAGQMRKVTPHLIPMLLPNLVPGHVSMKFKLQGPNICASTACATGVHAIGDAASLVSRGMADVMVAGAVELMLHPLVLVGYSRAKALCTKFNNDPQKASRPFDSKRAGFVPSEGAAVLVLEELEHAKRRGANIYAEILGYGLSGDAYHVTSPPPDGNGGQRSMKGALNDAGIEPEDVTHVNMHSTSTPVGDKIENFAVKQVFGEHAYNLLVYAPKGALGHTQGAAGAVESVITALSIKNGLVPPNLNLEEREPDFDLNYPVGGPAEWKCDKRRIALTNSFGFGGTNASLCIGEYRE